MLLKHNLNRLMMTALLTLSAASSIALTPQEQGLEIAKQAKSRDIGWVDNSADMLMYLRNQQGQESVRELKIKTLEELNDGDKALTIFNKPRDIKGTAFLSFSHPVGNDDQWLYLPSLKRIKRISSHNKSGPFMGSEFAFEDLSSFEVEKYTYEYLGDETIHGQDSFKVTQFPVDTNSGYTRRVTWVDKAEYRIQKIDFYDRKNALLKTLSYTHYQQYLNHYWRANTMTMVNHQSGKSTELKWSNYQFKSGLKSSDFNKNALKRIR